MSAAAFSANVGYASAPKTLVGAAPQRRPAVRCHEPVRRRARPQRSRAGRQQTVVERLRSSHFDKRSSSSASSVRMRSTAAARRLRRSVVYSRIAARATSCIERPSSSALRRNAAASSSDSRRFIATGSRYHCGTAVAAARRSRCRTPDAVRPRVDREPAGTFAGRRGANQRTPLHPFHPSVVAGQRRARPFSSPLGGAVRRPRARYVPDRIHERRSRNTAAHFCRRPQLARGNFHEGTGGPMTTTAVETVDRRELLHRRSRLRSMTRQPRSRRR